MCFHFSERGRLKRKAWGAPSGGDWGKPRGREEASERREGNSHHRPQMPVGNGGARTTKILAKNTES